MKNKKTISPPQPLGEWERALTVESALRWSDKHRLLTSKGARVAHISQLLRQEREKTIREMASYTQHETGCILSQWSGGQPTKDGGYEMKFGGKWYQTRPIDKTPKCSCGLSDLLSTLNKDK